MPNEETTIDGKGQTTDPTMEKQTQDDPKQADPKATDNKVADQGNKDPEPKTADPKQEDGEGNPDDKALADDDEKGKQPETYEKFSLPEGFEYDEALAGKFGGVAKELGLSQEQAQKLVDHYIGLTQEGIAAQTERFSKVSDEWVKTAENDKEFGGADFDQNIALAKTALDKFGSPELSKYLADSRLGNHPELIRFCWKVGKLLGDDHQPDDLATKSKDPNKKLSEDDVAKLLFGGQKK